MKDLLYLVHRIPYPPNKGDKIASFHLLKYLCERYRVHLGAFVDDPADMGHVKTVTDMVQGEVRIVELDPWRAKFRSLFGLLTGEALTVGYYRDQPFQEWVDGVIARYKIRRLVAFSGAMAQFVTCHRSSDMRRVVDFVDVDSDKWRQYASSRAWPMSWICRREAKVLLNFEKSVAREVDFSAFISPHELELFRSLAPDAADRLVVIGNGVDRQFFDPDRDYPNPYPAGEEVLVFTGAMDYWANVDAVCWFAREIFPAIRAHRPTVCFYIVGANPVSKVRKLSSLPAVRVTGRVEDVRPYLAHARLVVAPLRIARGIQNKVLEAMAMAKPVLVTRAGMEGIRDCPHQQGLVYDNAHELAEAALRFLASEDSEQTGASARRFISKQYDWSRNLEHLGALLEGEAPA